MVYVARENNQSITICVASTVQLERNVTIDIMMISGSAEGKLYQTLQDSLPNTFDTGGMDYIQQNFQPLIFGTVETQCLDIAIVDDTTVEDEENISVTLTTMEERVILDPQSAEIMIIDDDSKHLM